MIDQNYQTYTSPDIVWHYAQLSQLQPAEQTILDLFRVQLPTMRMLDIGIGGGRTTQHFANLTQTYTGIDYSPEMIAAYHHRFPECPHTIEVGDARNMQFADNSFDFILFSFNGIDSVSHSDRLQILQEVQRVGKQGCYFFFSSHNLQGMIKELNWRTQIRLNPLKTYINLMMLGLINLFNLDTIRNQIQTADYAIIKDEPHNFRLQNYYIHPQAQINQLAQFHNIEIYSWQSGLKITKNQELATNFDLWLYYLCTIN